MMLFPKDDSLGANAKEIINCRCSVKYIGNGKDAKSNATARSSDILKNKNVANTGEYAKITSKNENDRRPYAENAVKKQKSNELKRGIDTLKKRIAEHKQYICDPKTHCPDWDAYDARRQAGLIKHWEKEISNFEKSIDTRVKELKERGDWDG